MIRRTWGRRLRALRRAAGLTQHDLGVALGLPSAKAQGRVSRLERGVRLRSADAAAQLAAALRAALGERAAAQLGAPPVDVQAGTARGEARGGDRQRAPRRLTTCPHCGGEL